MSMVGGIEAGTVKVNHHYCTLPGVAKGRICMRDFFKGIWGSFKGVQGST